MAQFRVMIPLSAPKNNGGRVVYKQFNHGDIVTGERFNNSNTPSNHLQAVKTSDGYIIPEMNLAYLGGGQQRRRQFSNTVEDAQIIAEETNRPITVKDAVKNYMKSPKDMTATQQKISSYQTNGLIIGAVLGMVAGHYLGRGKISSALFGGFLGFYSGRIIANKS